MPRRSRSQTRASAAIAALAVAAFACTSGPEGGSTGPSRRAPAAQRDLLRFGVIGSPPTLDPYDRNASDLTYALARPVYPSLFRFLPSGAPQAALAARLDERNGAAFVTLKRASWSDGQPITARDVVASAQRAVPPSGFAGLNVRAVGKRIVRFRGEVRDWGERLATLAYVLPQGRANRSFGGPFTVARYTPGYEVVLRRNPRFHGTAARLTTIKVRFVQDLDLLLLLLERGRLDAGAPLATVNLDQRLDEVGLGYDRARGWEGMWLDLRRSQLSAARRSTLLSGIRFGAIAAAFVRDEGDLVVPARIAGGEDGPLEETLIGPSGDELLSLFMRAVWFQLHDRGHRIELLRVEPETLYGEWDPGSPPGIAVRRRLSAPGLEDPLSGERLALQVFSLDSFIAWNDGVAGLRVNPTIEGPLWNAERLSVVEP